MQIIMMDVFPTTGTEPEDSEWNIPPVCQISFCVLDDRGKPVLIPNTANLELNGLLYLNLNREGYCRVQLLETDKTGENNYEGFAENVAPSLAEKVVQILLGAI